MQTLAPRNNVLCVKPKQKHHTSKNTQTSVELKFRFVSGENPAAMQTGGRGLSWLHCSPSSWLILLTVAAVLC